MSALTSWLRALVGAAALMLFISIISVTKAVIG